jgi:hypothetical protein
MSYATIAVAARIARAAAVAAAAKERISVAPGYISLFLGTTESNDPQIFIRQHTIKDIKQNLP